MKKLICFLAIGMFLFAGCSKDAFFDESQEGFELKDAHKRANVPIPFKADLCAVPDMTSESIPLPDGTYCKKRMIIGGTGSHLGRVWDSGTSYYDVEGNEVLMEGGHPFLRQSGTGILVAANGDSFEWTWWAKISIPDRNWTGEFEIIPGSGTGKFEGSSGKLEAIGQANPAEHINCWTFNGYIEFN